MKIWLTIIRKSFGGVFSLLLCVFIFMIYMISSHDHLCYPFNNGVSKKGLNCPYYQLLPTPPRFISNLNKESDPSKSCDQAYKNIVYILYPWGYIPLLFEITNFMWPSLCAINLSVIWMCPHCKDALHTCGCTWYLTVSAKFENILEVEEVTYS